MALNTRKMKTKSKFVEQALLPVDSYPARVVQIIDLGLQDGGEWKGEKKKPVNKLHITYELVDCFMVDKDGNELEDKPRWLSEELNMFSPDADKAKCNQRYNAIDPECLHDYDWAAIVGSSCSVMVAHKESKGKTYANVGLVTPYVVTKRNPELVDLVNDAKVFNLEEPDMDVFDALPQWIKDKIMANLEFKGSPLQEALFGSTDDEEEEELPEPPKAKRKAKAKVEDDEDEIVGGW